jgi:hypothetical protein
MMRSLGEIRLCAMFVRSNQPNQATAANVRRSPTMNVTTKPMAIHRRRIWSSS